ncbi:MAG: lipid IV(A) 3-deoxy-D-manno-octulosonic acid transferase [Kangiellaceae bacterium]|nr:lipid IV(A) 3-deoxy-D-manno-octulosonic acid transferase [Kangiellaceae bacterium]MCW8997711.1 lipid IV(A) 3-deoxy-D-manno-octulosonic acid transferase [Kangiellaceae bacterium]
MNRFVYSLLLYLVAPFIWGYFLLRAFKAKEYREGARNRLGIGIKSPELDTIVIHCASMGESKAAIPLIESLIESHSNCQLVITTTTPTGKQVIKDHFGEKVVHYYLPVDWPGACKRFIAKLNPKLLVVMETELWPNFIHYASRKSIPILLANARLSSRSRDKYLKHKAFSLDMLNKISHIAAQYSSDKSHFESLGVAKEKVSVVGNIKFDIQLSAEIRQKQEQLKAEWRLNRPVWLAASIHPGEFNSILKAHKNLLKEYPNALLIGVPRHPEKFAEFSDCVSKQNFRAIRRSTGDAVTDATQVVIGDTMGEMLAFCGVSDIAFVGGSLIDNGGHNPLEPIMCDVPVLMGPSYFSFLDIGDELCKKSVLFFCQDSGEILRYLKQAFNSPESLLALKKSSHQVIKENQGACEKLAAIARDLVGFDIER